MSDGEYPDHPDNPKHNDDVIGCLRFCAHQVVVPLVTDIRGYDVHLRNAEATTYNYVCVHGLYDLNTAQYP